MPRAILLCFTLVLSTGCKQKPFEPFRSSEGVFEAKFPGEPKFTKTTAAGISLKMYAVESWSRAYMIGWADLPIPKWEPEGKTKSRLFDARDGALAAVKAKSNGTTKVITHQNRFPGIEFGGVADGNKHLRAQIFLVGHRLYQVLIVGKSADLLTAPEAEEFFAAFQVGDVESLLPPGWSVPGSSAALPPPAPSPRMNSIESNAGRFIAQFPVKPKKFTRTIGAHEFSGYASESDGGTCSVGYVDLPIPGGESKAKVRERLDAARTAALADAQTTLADEKAIAIGSGRPGRELRAPRRGRNSAAASTSLAPASTKSSSAAPKRSPTRRKQQLSSIRSH